MEAVAPFDIWLDRRKRTKFLNSLGSTLETHTKPKVLRDAGIALASLVICEEALERELIISTSYVVLLILSFACLLNSVCEPVLLVLYTSKRVFNLIFN